MSKTLNAERRRQFADLMSESGWDVLYLYGHSWRKDFFRSLINFNFFGPHAAAALDKRGEISILVSHPWDEAALRQNLQANVECAPDFRRGLEHFRSKFKTASCAI